VPPGLDCRQVEREGDPEGHYSHEIKSVEPMSQKRPPCKADPLLLAGVTWLIDLGLCACESPHDRRCGISSVGSLFACRLLLSVGHEEIHTPITQGSFDAQIPIDSTVLSSILDESRD
jgi:hypothetical protein